MNNIKEEARKLLESFRSTALQTGVSIEIPRLYLFKVSDTNMDVQAIRVTEIIVSGERASAFLPSLGEYIHAAGVSDERKDS